MIEKLTIDEINLAIQKKEFNYLDLICAYEKQFEKFVQLNAHTQAFWEEAKEKAKQQKNIGPLSGIPVAVKDIFLMKGKKTTVCSKVLKDFVAPYESFTTAKMQSQGAIVPFKTNMDEFAMGTSNETSIFGPVINPWILKDGLPRVPGGSSGGSAAAVAAHMCVGALGTDTGGSIRQPAAFCGIVGFKPSYGRCSRRGVVAFASSLDHPGVLARTVQDACHIMEGIAGYDDRDSTSINEEVPKLTSIKGNVKGKTIGVAFDAFSNLNKEYKEALMNLVNDLKTQGAIIKEILPLSFELALRLYVIIAPAEAASNLARYDGLRYSNRGQETQGFEEILYSSRALFGTEVKRRILIGNFVLFSNEYEKFFGRAYKLREQLRYQVDEMFNELDALILPTTPAPAFAIGQQRCAWEMYHEDLYTTLGNIYGGPSIQIPLCKVDVQSEQKGEGVECLAVQEKLPMGIQVMAKIRNEAGAVEIAKKIEEMVDWKGI